LPAAAVVAAGVAILFSPDPAPLVFGLGLALAVFEIVRGKLNSSTAIRAVGPVMLAGLFGLAVGLGALGRAWNGPATLMAQSGRAGTVVISAAAAVIFNNLPAAVLLGSSHPEHARALLLGLNIGPNLAVSGSLSAVLWWRAARLVSARPSAKTYSRVGLVLVPISLAGAVLALTATAPGRL